MVKLAVKEAAVASAVKERLVGGIGSMTDKLFDLREKKRELEDKIKALETEAGEIEEVLMGRLEAEGTRNGSGRKASISITVTEVANVIDWDDFHKWIKRTGNFQVLQRRVSDAAWREVRDLKGVAPPGTQTFSKKRLNLRAL